MRRRLLFASRLLLYFVPTFCLLAVPALVLAQHDGAPQFDVVAWISALPLPMTAKSALLVGFPLVYFLCTVARAFTPPTSVVGRLVRVILDGVKHPDERPSAPESPPMVLSQEGPPADLR